MIAQYQNQEPVDLNLYRRLKEMRRTGRISDADRVVFFAPDEPVRLYSGFGHGADDETFNGIAAANFRALNPGLAGR